MLTCTAPFLHSCVRKIFGSGGTSDMCGDTVAFACIFFSSTVTTLYIFVGRGNI